MTLKEYLAPDAEFIEFDVSDVITASLNGEVCDFEATSTSVCLTAATNTDFAWCSLNGDPGRENTCQGVMGAICPTRPGTWYTCYNNGFSSNCTSSGNFYYTNQTDPRH